MKSSILPGQTINAFDYCLEEGIEFLRKNDLHKARKYFEKAHQFDHQNKYPHLGLALVRYQIERETQFSAGSYKILNCLNQALALDPFDETIAMFLAVCKKELKLSKFKEQYFKLQPTRKSVFRPSFANSNDLYAHFFKEYINNLLANGNEKLKTEKTNFLMSSYESAMFHVHSALPSILELNHYNTSETQEYQQQWQDIKTDITNERFDKACSSLKKLENRLTLFLNKEQLARDAVNELTNKITNHLSALNAYKSSELTEEYKSKWETLKIQIEKKDYHEVLPLLKNLNNSLCMFFAAEKMKTQPAFKPRFKNMCST